MATMDDLEPIYHSMLIAAGLDYNIQLKVPRNFFSNSNPSTIIIPDFELTKWIASDYNLRLTDYIWVTNEDPNYFYRQTNNFGNPFSYSGYTQTLFLSKRELITILPPTPKQTVSPYARLMKILTSPKITS